jgi:hypothetical protein
MAIVALRDPFPSDSALSPLFRDVTPAQRVAGGMLVVNAVVSFAALALVPAAMQSAAFLGPGTIVSGIFDIVIGTLLIMNYGRLLPWALVRTALGLVLFTVLHVSAGDLLNAGVQVGISGALLLLLIGRAGIVRLTIGCVLFSLYLLFSVAGLSVVLTGHNPLGGVILGLKGELDGEATGVLEGVASPYHLQVPDSGWYRRTRAIALRDNALTDQWLVQPNRDNHVLVIDEPVPGGVAPIELYTDAVIGNTKKAATSFTLVSREPLAAYPEVGRLIHTKYSIQGLNFESWIGLVSAPGHSYQIMAMSQQIGFAAASSELRAMVESFRLPDAAALLPAGVEPGPAGRVLGVDGSYAITAPGELWHLRTAEAAHADNPATDRWLIRPDRDAHVFVTFEDTAEPVPIAALATTLQDLMRSHNSAVEFGPTQEGPRGSLGFHATAPAAQMTIEFEYRLHVVDRRAFQVVAFARKEHYPGVADELRQVLDSFEPLSP